MVPEKGRKTAVVVIYAFYEWLLTVRILEIFVADINFADVASAAAINVNVTNMAATSQQDAATSELNLTDQTLPPKPKCKLWSYELLQTARK